jgi:arylsulfatase
MGGITEIATAAPGYNSVRPNTAAPLAETLKLNGFSTAQFGKCHEVPVWETSSMGPFDAWPSGGGGFERFYGFVGVEEVAAPFPDIAAGAPRAAYSHSASVGSLMPLH